MVNSITIELGGKDRLLKFNQVSLEVYTNHIIDVAPNTSVVYATFYAGLFGGAVANGYDPKQFAYTEVQDWVDELLSTDEGETVKNDVLHLWSETFAYKKWVKELNKAEELLTSEEDPIGKKKVS